MSLPTTFDLVFLQRMGGGTEIMQRNIPASDALRTLQEALDRDLGAGGTAFLRPSGDFLADVTAELEHARTLNAPLNSAHEAYAVILEELAEFWEEVRKRRSDRDRAKMRAELVQVAAMCARAVEDLEL